MNKQFTLKQKIKYIKLIKKYGFDEALIHFVVEFEDRYTKYKGLDGTKRKDALPTTQGKQRLKYWWNKYKLGDMKELKSKSGKTKKTNWGRRKRVSIN